ncbi:MAG TPA: glycosyltransferase family 4 protein [Flavisolibacter sp.]|nr:glycosyltransferase family 4 protein [Flavisolibacter sp.]
MAQSPENHSHDNIKILSVVWYKVLPPNFGGQKAIAYLNEHLGRLAPLLCLCSNDNEAASTTYRNHPILPTNKLQFINPFVWRKIYLFAKRKKATHLIIEFPYHGIAGFICKKLLGVKLIVNTHNIEFKRFEQQKKWWWLLLYHYEGWVYKVANAVFFKTDSDKQIAQKQLGLQGGKSAVIPYGIAEAESLSRTDAQAIIRARHEISKEDKILLFAGTLDYQPNAEGVIAIKTQVIPRLNNAPFHYKIIVCGRNNLSQFDYLNKISDPNLIRAGEVNDISLYYKAADAFINPVASGGGIQTKIIDALFYHLSVVCFTSKRSGIYQAGNKLFSVDDFDWEGFVAATIKASATVQETPSAFFEHYNWRSIATKAYHRISSL